MKHGSPPLLFHADRTATDPLYCHFRDQPNPVAITCRRFVEQLWATFYPFSDAGFIEDVGLNFQQRFWEMYLTCVLLRHQQSLGYTVSCPKPGPDVLLQFPGRRVWIEAIAPTGGKQGLPDSLIPGEIEPSRQVPEEKILLRLTSAIREKSEKYKRYRENQIIGEHDAYVVAVNGWSIPKSLSEPDTPFIVRAVFEVGASILTIDPVPKSAIYSGSAKREGVAKANGVVISTGAFCSPAYATVSGILYSWSNPFAAAATSDPPLGSDFQIVHNPFATESLVLGQIPSSAEWVADPNISTINPHLGTLAVVHESA